MKLIITSAILIFNALFILIGSLQAMGLRSFVALPLEENGHVLRVIAEHNEKSSSNVLKANYAYGISAKQTLLFGMPYRLSPSGNNRAGNVSALYRHTIIQDDKKDSTFRLALLGGGILPLKSESDGSIQAGAVATFAQNRHGVDIDFLYRKGLGNDKNTARYDLSWQYRLSPSVYPQWGINPEWHMVIELNGRYLEGNSITHQVTTGLQWIDKECVFEGGVFKDINNDHNTGFLLSSRLHF